MLGGYLLSDGRCLLCPGMSRRTSFPSSSCNRDPILFRSANVKLKTFPLYGPRRVSFLCNASSNNPKRNQDFSRQQKGSSRGRVKQFQERDNSENMEEADLLSSKNGPLLSLTSNPRYQATAIPGQREKEIVELFRKVQAQLRERAAIKEEKKIEAAQQGQAERGTVDSLLKLLRKHSVDQKKKSGGEEDFNLDQLERSNPFEDDQNSNIFGPNNITPEEAHGADAVTRPASNFRRRSPVPRVKFQPVFSAEEDVSSTPSLKSQGKKKRGKDEPEPASDSESISLDGPDEVYLDDQSEISDADETSEETVESSAAEKNADLGSMKLSELRGLAKSQGIKGYSKMNKGKLLELLSG